MKIFLSYSSKDHVYKDEIKITLSVLKRENKIHLWVDDEKLKVGDIFDSIIKKEIIDSDIFLLLLSRNFWASDYIQEQELPLILKQSAEKNAIIIPIILKDTGDLLNHDEVKNINAIPRDEKDDKRLLPIDTFESQEKAYNSILSSIQNLITTSKNYIPYLELSRYSLKTLSPYNDLEKIELREIVHKNETTFEIEFIEHYESQKKVDKILIFSYSKKEKEFLIAKFSNSKQFNAISNQLKTQKLITKYQILSYLDTTLEVLFPVPSRIKSIEKFIQTDDIKGITDLLQSKTSQKLLAYGSAGVGKTSTLSSLKSIFSDALVLIYDSFGGGTYKDFGAQRHLQQKILTQLINETAIGLGFELLLEQKFNIYDLELKFKLYIEEASKTLDKKKVIIIIDAADNNVDGAKYFNEEPYIPKLWSLNLPEHCYLIMSARGGLRKDSLLAPNDVLDFELKGFDIESTKQFLTQYFPKLEEKIALSFHKLTKGNPRIENYILQQINGNYDRIEALVKKDETISLEKIFEDMWEQALAVIEPITREHVEELICMSRPAKIDDFMLASGLTKNESLKITQTLEPGITVDQEHTIGFQDEDFETFLSTKIDEHTALNTHNRISKNLFTKIVSNHYATKYIAFHLEKAGNYTSLIDITLNFNLEHIEDRLERKEIQKDRVQRALNMALEKKDYQNIYKLLYLVSELTKSDNTLHEFLQDSPELLSIYTNEENAVSYYTSNFENLENLNYRCAYLLSKVNNKRSIEFLKVGDVWLRKTLDRRKEDKGGHANNIDTSDIAKRSISAYYTEGLEKCIESFSVWRLWFLIQVINDIPKDFLLEMTIEKQEEIYEKYHTRMHPFVQAKLLVLLNNIGNTPSRELVHRVAKKLYRYIQLKPKRIEILQGNRGYMHRDDLNTISLDFSILALKFGFDKKIILPTILKTTTQSFETLHDDHSLRGFYETFLALGLKHTIETNEIDYDELIKEKDNPSYTDTEDRKRKIGYIKNIMPYFQFYTKVIVNQLDFSTIEKEWTTSLEKATPSWHNQREYQGFAIKFELLTKILIMTNADRTAFIALIQNLKSIMDKYNLIQKITPILLEGRYLDEAFELIDLDVNITQKESLPAQDKVDVFNNYAKLVRFYDEERAKIYFELALEATGGLDDKVYFLYKFLVSLTQYVLPVLEKNEKYKLVNRNVAVVESLQGYLYETGDLVLNEAIKLIAHLDFSLALNIAHQWDNKIIYKQEKSLSEILPIAIEKEDLEYENLFSLRFLVKNSDILDTFLLLIEKFNETSKDALFNIIEKMIDFIRKNLSDKDQVSTLDAIRKWLSHNGYSSHTLTLELEKYHKFFKENNINPDNYIPPYTHKETIENWDNFFIPYLIDLPKYLTEMDKKISGYDTGRLLSEARSRLKYNQKVSWLEAICNVRVFYLKHYIDEFLTCILEWESDIQVNRHKEALIEKFVYTYSSRLLDSDEYITRLSHYVPKNRLYEIILNEEVKKSFSYELRDLYRLMDVSKEILKKDDAKNVMYDIFGRLENQLDTTPCNFNPNNYKEALVTFLWKQMGHPDRRIRWKAKYSTRELLKSSHTFIPMFIDKFSTYDGFPFTNDLSFYTISAKESLLLVFHRLSFEITDALKPYLKDFKNIVFDEDFPHIIIREIAKAITINLSNVQEMRLRLANSPRSCLIKKQTQGYGWNHQTRFNFDSMDTIPYWYNSMQNIYDIEMIDILKDAETWIIDKWGQNDAIEAKYLRHRWERDDYHLTSHRHGELPTIEEPVRHLEFESMFLVAGELLRTHSVNIERYSDGDVSEYDYFLGRYFENNDFWLSEFRQAKPLEAFPWGIFEREHNLEKFDNLLGITNDSWILHGNYNIYLERYSETIDISSALVSPNSSKTLLKLLQKADYYDYHMPIKNDDKTFTYQGYDLTGWIDSISLDLEKDSHDPYTHNMQSTLHLPSEEFIKICNLSIDKYKAIFTQNKKLIVKIERWSDDEKADYYDKFSSSGERMHVNSNAMIHYLQNKNMDLIISVTISNGEQKLGENEKKYSKKTILYLLTKDGDLERADKIKIV
ncbi:toll/interleukin-1 receptor domain-containing protein [Sulfurovum sp. NBC37-1]|uniref:toll/interleukin-1 receptor domain-containing protein n=1 Tax=Sulfurovum sp. (strain NBC37-1) TaxID=387093 RepID=UPI0001587B3D|nr:toll/interleukin-1 receptor domain-containing protein [Sulfurovum sp. NBC37-1]BAF73049.1 conserved hypothetical protein [Sulfurovum sp. NBC37-1]